VLAQPAQAAAQQDSVAPLLQSLSSLGRQLSQMPAPVVEAAARLLAERIPLDRGGPSAALLKAAVQRAGVLAEPARPTSQSDVKASLLQLRAGLMKMLGGDGAIDSVAAIGRRPPPPLPDAQPRGMRSDPPNPNADASPKDTGRALLHQTDAALSRLKLTQLASQPADTMRAGPMRPDFMVELPMTLGGELSVMQLQVQRDGKNKGRASERGWRVRFAVSFSAIGEVCAQVSLLGKTANVLIWADEAETADALDEMLPDLAPALAKHGLTVGSVRLRRGAPEPEPAKSGRLMDTLT
jgi:hypothetical protein